MQQEEPSLYRSGATATMEAPRPVSAPAGRGAAAKPPAGGSVSWTASEFIDHDRNFGWFIMLAFGTVVLGAFVYLLSKDYISTGIIVVLGIVVGAIAKRKPRQITYELNDAGLLVGGKLYRYGTFKSFSIIREDAVPSIVMSPLRRFMPPMSLYFAPQDEEQITSALSAHLPYHEQQLDGLEKLSRRLKF